MVSKWTGKDNLSEIEELSNNLYLHCHNGNHTLESYTKLVQISSKPSADNLRIIYPCLGLAGELGEVIEHVKKVVRDQGGLFTEKNKERLKDELGDVLWYFTRLCSDLDISLMDVILSNVKKLEDRAKNGKR